MLVMVSLAVGVRGSQFEALSEVSGAVPAWGRGAVRAMW
ncbi:hypothetical protein K701_16200 [Streptomyces fradiae ATCC 10745 = DSM 40063]|uniref:Uncharacterized protein n=1 Tax=Streptomyces fradiae ATCC 10745 = DSM 40063 TaxID=1319510 RepID=A0ABQ6XT13_STRFR|nr:hypothetical protein K701_16200 [Streptomyces fradiae ATCC 10745 = DSM 40063]